MDHGLKTSEQLTFGAESLEGHRTSHGILPPAELFMLKLISPDFVFHSKLPQHETIKPALFADALRTCAKKAGDWNCDVLTNRDSKDVDYSAFLEAFRPLVTAFCDAVGTRGPMELRLEALWMNLYNKGAWQELHHHSTPANNISFVYFLNYNPDSDGQFFFLNERSSHYSASGLHNVFKLAENLNIAELVPIPVQDGDVILFPSQLRHGVTMQRHDTNRCTLAGNLLVLPQKTQPE